MVEERERACDEEVLRLGSEPKIYAEGILKVCELYLESPLECVAGVTGSNLRRRIRAIMTHRGVERMKMGKKAYGTLLVLVLVIGWVVLFVQSRRSERFRRFLRVVWLSIWVGVVALFLGVLAVQALWPGYWIAVSDQTWNVEDGVLVMDSLTLSNTVGVEMKDFTIECDVQGNSGTTIEGLKTTIYEVVPNEQKRTFYGLKVGRFPTQGVNVNCHVVDAAHVWNSASKRP